MSNEKSGNSVSAGRDILNSPINQDDGDQNVIYNMQEVAVPDAETVQIGEELQALVKLLQERLTDDIERQSTLPVLEEAAAQAENGTGDRSAIGRAMELSLDALKKTNEAASHIEAVRPTVVRAVGWLGQNWKVLLTTVGAVATNPGWGA